MWEITIFGEMRDFVYFTLLEEELKEKLKDNVVVALSISSKLACSIALNDRKYLSLVRNEIFECILKCVKDEYFRENIHIDEMGLKELVVSSLIYINLNDEIDYAKERINLSKTVYIRSLVRFRLNRLFHIWEKFLYYFNQKNGNGMAYLDFLKILATTSSQKGEIIFIEKIQDNMCILDRNKEIISSSSSKDEIGVVVNLITLCPQRIIINSVHALSESILKLLNYIFEDRISMLL